MSLKFAVVSGPASTGDQVMDYTSTGFGTPEACLLVSRMGFSNNIYPMAECSVGLSDGTNEANIIFCSRNNLSSSDTNSFYINSKGVTTVNTSRVIDERADISFVTDAMRLTWDATPGSSVGHRIHSLIIKGVTNVHQGWCNPTTGGTDITAPGFKPDLVICMSTRASEVSGQVYLVRYSIGFAHNSSTDTVTEASIGIVARDNQSTAEGDSIIRDDCSCMGLEYTGVVWKSVLSDFDANGFTATSSADASVQGFYYLAIKGDDPDDFDISIIDTPTSTGTQAYTGVGFEPGGMIFLQSTLTATNTFTSDTTDESGVIGFGLAGSDLSQAATSYADEVGASTTNTQSGGNESGISRLYFDNGDLAYEADVDSFDSDGYTLDFTTVNAPGTTTARKWIALSFKGPVTNTGTSTMNGVGTVTASGTFKDFIDNTDPPITGGGRIMTAGTFPEWWEPWEEPQPTVAPPKPKPNVAALIAEAASELDFPSTPTRVVERRVRIRPMKQPLAISVKFVVEQRPVVVSERATSFKVEAIMETSGRLEQFSSPLWRAKREERRMVGMLLLMKLLD